MSSLGCDLTEADDETAEKEVKIVAKEVVGRAPSLAETSAGSGRGTRIQRIINRASSKLVQM